MLGSLLWRGMLAGLCAGILAFGFASVVGEPQVNTAISFEEQHARAAGEPSMPPLVPRDVQSTAGLFAGGGAFGVAVGGAFAPAVSAGVWPGRPCCPPATTRSRRRSPPTRCGTSGWRRSACRPSRGRRSASCSRGSRSGSCAGQGPLQLVQVREVVAGHLPDHDLHGLRALLLVDGVPLP